MPCFAAPASKLQHPQRPPGKAPEAHPRLLGQVSVHLLLAERRHVLDLLVVALHDLAVLGDLFGIQELVGWRVLGREWHSEMLQACSVAEPAS